MKTLTYLRIRIGGVTKHTSLNHQPSNGERMKARQLIGTDTLDEAVKMYKQRIPVATIVRVLKLDTVMHYRTAYNIIKADVAGCKKATRPEWLNTQPATQFAPKGWVLVDELTKKGHWILEG